MLQSFNRDELVAIVKDKGANPGSRISAVVSLGRGGFSQDEFRTLLGELGEDDAGVREVVNQWIVKLETPYCCF